MAALPYMQLYVADYLADTMHLTAEEHGAYLLLIMNYWQTGKPIKQNRIQAITKISNERITDVTETLQEFFNVDDNGLWHHFRIDEELEKVRSKSIKASEAGKKSAAKRWGSNKKVTDVIANVTETLQQKGNHTDTETETDTDTDKKNKNVKKRAKGMDMLLKAGVPEDLAEDYLAVRRAKKAPFTKTAMKGLAGEAEKANIDLNQAITICINRNWASFNSEWSWDTKKNGNNHGTNKSLYKSAIQTAAESISQAVQDDFTEHQQSFCPDVRNIR